MMSTTALSTTTKKAPNIVITSTGGTSSCWIDVGRVLAHALQVEDRLREDRAAADHGREVEAEERDHRDQRVAEHVVDQHSALAEALGPRRADVVLVDGVEDVRSQHPGVEADEEHRQHEPGQEQVR